MLAKTLTKRKRISCHRTLEASRRQRRSALGRQVRHSTRQQPQTVHFLRAFHLVSKYCTPATTMIVPTAILIPAGEAKMPDSAPTRPPEIISAIESKVRIRFVSAPTNQSAAPARQTNCPKKSPQASRHGTLSIGLPRQSELTVTYPVVKACKAEYNVQIANPQNSMPPMEARSQSGFSAGGGPCVSIGQCLTQCPPHTPAE